MSDSATQSPSEARPKRDRGAALLISLAILALLSLFATAFVRLVNFEKSASTNYSDGVRARLLAKAGISHAVVELQRIAAAKHYSNIHYTNGPVTKDRWGYGLKQPLTNINMDRADLKLNLMTTLEPSFLLDISAGYPNFKHHGKDLAMSGVLGSSYENGIDGYKLKVIDAAAQVNVNLGVLGLYKEDQSIRRMLKNMLRSAAASDLLWNGMNEAAAEELANYVVDNRPLTGFASKAEVQRLMTVDPTSVTGFSELNQNNMVTEDRWLYAARYGGRPAMRDMLTVHSWVDEKVIRPWRLNGDAKRELPLAPRAPININTAPKPVLVALFAEIRAENDYAEPEISYDMANDFATQIMNRRGDGPSAGSAPVRGPFKTWEEFERWIDRTGDVCSALAPPSGTSWIHYQNNTALTQTERENALVPEDTYSGQSPTWIAIQDGQAHRDLIKAMLNPNTMLNKFGQGVNHGGSNERAGSMANNDFPLPRLVDKSDLVNITTEGAFDSMGVFEVTSLGMVLKKEAGAAEALINAGVSEPIDNNEVAVIAAHTEVRVIRIYDVLRLTTQADFEQSRALFATGDFVPDYKHWKNLFGYNRPAFKDFAGWPGVISHPVYSLVRDGTQLQLIDTTKHYVPATYDGNLTLSNLLGANINKLDFIAGFARGDTSAFKVRVWWNPKDQDPSSGNPIDPLQPSGPLGVIPPTNTTNLDQWYEDAESPNPDNMYDVGADGAPSALGKSFNALAGPMNENVLMQGLYSGLYDPLDIKTDFSGTLSSRWFREGSSLWNNGVASGPFRNGEAGNPNAPPTVLAFDSDNLNLNSGCSIRFWTQPLVDPWLRDVEVLFSFVGSKTGQNRDVGFRVIKRREGVAGISIVLQACPSSDSTRPGTGNQLMRWHHEDAPGGVWKDTVTIDVSPRTVAGDPQGSPYDGAGEAIDPFNPEWYQNSWHWIVINYGYTGRTRDETDGGHTLAQVDMSLQVDLKPTQPPKGADFDSGDDPGRIAFLGDSFSKYYGELHGFDVTNTLHGVAPDMSYLGAWTGEPPLAGGPLIGESGNFGGIKAPPNGTTRTMTLVRRAEYYATFFITQRMLGDFYNCDINEDASINGTSLSADEEIILPNAVSHNGGNPGDYVINEPIVFPTNAIDTRVWLEFRKNGPSGPIVSRTRDPGVDANGDPLGPPIVIIPSNGRVKLELKGGQWELPGSGKFEPEMMGDDDVYPTHANNVDDYVVNVVMKYKTYAKVIECECCTAKQSGGTWDGQFMQAFSTGGLDPGTHNAPPADPKYPNGCHHDSGYTKIHTWGPNEAVGLGGMFKCWVPFKANLTGHTYQNRVPGPDPLPYDLMCDDCHGCESCDVDGPMFLGGEPGNRGVLPPHTAASNHATLFRRNYVTVGTANVLAPIDKATVAYAVFDNLVIKNNSARRTDWIPAPGDVVDWFEDRYFESAASNDYFVNVSANASTSDPNAGDIGDPSTGYGAVYHRGLLELMDGKRVKLGTLTWTSYVAHEGNNELTYRVRMWRLPGAPTGDPQPWRPDNKDIVNPTSTPPTWPHHASYEEMQAGVPIAVRFPAPGPSITAAAHTYSGARNEDNNTEPDVLVLGLQLAQMTTGGETDRTEYDDDATFVTQSGLPTPILESPVFEDLTLSLIRESPQVLYAEEGGAE